MKVPSQKRRDKGPGGGKFCIRILDFKRNQKKSKFVITNFRFALREIRNRVKEEEEEEFLRNRLMSNNFDIS